MIRLAHGNIVVEFEYAEGDLDQRQRWHDRWSMGLIAGLLAVYGIPKEGIAGSLR
jgi:hypothetical protein